jgi:DHA1 family inner membrane transport protein
VGPAASAASSRLQLHLADAHRGVRLLESGVPVALALFGIGMTVGTEIGGRLADWSVVRTIFLGLGSTAVVLAAFPFTAGGVVTAGLSVLLIAVTGSLCLPALQTRLMDVAGDAQTLAAAGQHAALNVANALGAWLGGVVIAAGLGLDGAGRRRCAAGRRRAGRAHRVRGARAARRRPRPRRLASGDGGGRMRRSGTL